MHRLNCSGACGVFPDQGSNPGLLHWQADSLPLSHLGSLKNYAQREINISWHIHVILVVRLNMGKLGWWERSVCINYWSVIYPLGINTCSSRTLENHPWGNQENPLFTKVFLFKVSFVLKTKSSPASLWIIKTERWTKLLALKQDLKSQQVRQQACLAHIPETITYGRGLSYPSALDVCLLDPNKAGGRKTSQAGHYLGQSKSL